MQVKKTAQSDTKVKLTVVPNLGELTAIKDQVLLHFSKNHTNIPGFRVGKAPLKVIEKHVDPQLLQTEFLDSALNQLYVKAVELEKLRPIDQPTVTIQKFVPFSTLEFEVEVETVGEIKLAEYKKIKLAKNDVSVTASEVDEVLKSLRQRAAKKVDVNRKAKAGDEVTIDFFGADAKNGDPINGADGKDYPLILGSDSFIPGFEAEVIGMEVGKEKEFTLTFPKDYSVSALQNRKVTFRVTISKVKELSEPELNDEFAKMVSPLPNLKALKDDIKKQLLNEKKSKEDRNYENQLLAEITENSQVVIPKKLVDNQIEKSETEEKQNLAYRGQTWQEHLKEEGISEEQHRERNRPVAEQTVKASLVLSEIAEAENISVSSDEIDLRIRLLKGQYQDSHMQAELDKNENRQAIASQLLTEKTFEVLVRSASK